MKVWNVAPGTTGHTLFTMVGHKEEITAMKVICDGKMIVSGFYNFFYIFDFFLGCNEAETQTNTQTKKQKKTEKMLGSRDGKIIFWDTHTFECIYETEVKIKTDAAAFYNDPNKTNTRQFNINPISPCSTMDFQNNSEIMLGYDDTDTADVFVTTDDGTAHHLSIIKESKNNSSKNTPSQVCTLLFFIFLFFCFIFFIFWFFVCFV